MRTVLLCVIAACGGGASVPDAPGAAIVDLRCSRLGPDGTGFMIDSEFLVSLENQQAFTVDFAFPTAAAPINRSDIYICGSWTNFSNGGEPPEGCEAPIVIDGSGAQTETVFHSLAIEFPDPLPPPVSVTVRANPLASPEQPVVIGTPGVGTVDCQ